MNDESIHVSLIYYARQMHVQNLSLANSGNLSVRYKDGFLVTPSGVAYENLAPEDLVYLDLEGNQLEGNNKPSSEWRFHRDIYLEKNTVNAIVHAHSRCATALSCHRKALPAFHYMVALFGGSEVPCTAYQTFGTQALSNEITRLMHSYNACLLANHGMVTTGRDLELAFTRAIELESLCEQYIQALALGEPVLLSEQEMLEARDSFASYGQ